MVCEYGAQLSGSTVVALNKTGKSQAMQPILEVNCPSATIPSPELSTIAAMPMVNQALELVDIFVREFSRMLPCFREAALREAFGKEEIQNQAPVLAYAIFAMAAPYHPDPSIQAQARSWYTNAKLSYDLTNYQGEPALRVLQGSICIIFHAFTIMDTSTIWLFLAKAWRQACATGLSRIDSDLEPLIGHMAANSSPLAREEQRRSMWTLFLLDRGSSYSIGYPHAIDERQFVVNLPLPGSAFRIGKDILVSPAPIWPYATASAEALAEQKRHTKSTG